jgi:hypothetical protein
MFSIHSLLAHTPFHLKGFIVNQSRFLANVLAVSFAALSVSASVPALAQAPAPAAPAAAATPVANPAIADSTGFDAEFEKNRKRMEGKFEEKKTEQIQAAPLIQEDSWLSPPALVGMGGVAGAALMYGGSKALPIVKRWLSSGQNAPQGLALEALDEPPLFGSPAQRQPFEVAEPPLFSQTPAQPAGDFEPPMSRAPAPSQNLTLEEAQARMAGVTPAAVSAAPVAPPVNAAIAPIDPATRAANQAIIAAHQAEMAINNEKIANQNAAPSAAPNSPATKAVTETIQQLVQEETPVAGAAMPSRPVTPTPTAVLPERVQTAITGVPKTVQDQYAKEGKVVLKGYGVGDRSLTNTYGIPAYAKIIDYFNEGKPIGDDANYQIIRKKINQGVPASLAAEFAAKLPGSEAEAGNFGKAFGETGAYTKEGKIVTSPAAMKKAVAGGGALFLATAFPNIVNAAESASKGDYAKAGGQAAGVAYGAMGPLAQLLSGTGNAGLSAEEEARQLRMRDYALKAGRGVGQGYDPRQLINVAPPTR